ncbi:FkbM family methyltransferase [Roseospira navarrensis]|uniref:FkbM family methyltransferase n=1 Tax=Roseospira navarrensis TaxID=140058 RepID=UPI0014797299
MTLQTAVLPDGRTISCVNTYEVAFAAHEIFSDDLTAHRVTLPAAGVFLDIGANIGLFALRLRDKCPQARIIAFECIPAIYRALEANAAALDPPIEAVNLGLWDRPGTLVFDYFPGVAALSTARPEVGRTLADGLRALLSGQGVADDVRALIEHTGADAARDDPAFLDHLFRTEPVTARVDTLSNQIAVLGLDRVDLLKIDVEGAERTVLAGLSDQDWPKVRQLVVEAHQGEDDTLALAADLRARGYRATIGGHPLSQGGAPVFHVYATRDA